MTPSCFHEFLLSSPLLSSPLLSWLMFSLLASPAASALEPGQLIPSRLLHEPNLGGVIRWQSEAGYRYRVESGRTGPVLENGVEVQKMIWSRLSPKFYGTGSDLFCPLFPYQAPPAAVPTDPNAPPPPPTVSIQILSFPDHSALLQWMGEGQLRQHYVASYQLTSTSLPQISFSTASLPSGTLATDPIYSVMVLGAAKTTLHTQFTFTGTDPIKTKLTGTTFRQSLQTAIGSSATAAAAQAAQGFTADTSFDRELYRVIRLPLDSDGDGLKDHQEIATTPGVLPTTLAVNAQGVPAVFTRLIDARRAARTAAGLPQPTADLLITEFSPHNENGIGDYASPTPSAGAEIQPYDWIEIYNPTDQTVNLANWKLSDNTTTPFKWSFPSSGAPVLAPNQRIIVFVSNLVRSNVWTNPTPGATPQTLVWHTSFGLRNDSEAILLTAPNNVTSDSHSYLGSGPDISLGYGFDPELEHGFAFVSKADGSPDFFQPKLRYFATPTPGAPNAADSYLGVLPPPAISAPSGYLSAPSLTTAITPSLQPSLTTEDLSLEQTSLLGIKIADSTDPLSVYVWSKLNSTTKLNLSTRPIVSTVLPSVRSELIEELNKMIVSANLITDLFGPISPRLANTQAVALIQPLLNPTWANRVFMEDAYPEIRQLVTPQIYHTLNAAEPTQLSYPYTGPLQITGRTVLRAYSHLDGWLPSKPVTATYVRPSDVLTQTKPAGYPDQTENNTVGTHATNPTQPTRLAYGVSPEVAFESGSAILDSLATQPAVFLTVPVLDFFHYESGGIYAQGGNTDSLDLDPLLLKFERIADFEYWDPITGLRANDRCQLELTGSSSRRNHVTLKHNLKVGFKRNLSYKNEGKIKFPDSPSKPLIGTNLLNFNSLVLRNPTSDSWVTSSVVQEEQLAFLRAEATYLKESYANVLFAQMGHLVTHRRSVHLFINGLYWGMHEMTEHVDEDFLQDNWNEKTTYDIVKQRAHPADTMPELVTGDFARWNALRTAVVNAQAAPANWVLYAQVEALLDIPQYCDYLLLNWFLANTDWPNNNWRMYARRAGVDASGNPVAAGPFRALLWDSEFSMGQPYSNLAIVFHTGNPYYVDRCVDQFCERLLAHPKFVSAMKARVTKHFIEPTGLFYSSSPTLPPTQARDLWISEMARFEPFVKAESLRWGHVYQNKTVTSWSLPTIYRESDPTYLPGQTKGDWRRSTGYVRDTWLKARRALFLDKLHEHGLKP